MSNAIVSAAAIQALKVVAHFELGDGAILERVAARVAHWDEQAISNVEKHHNVLADMEKIGLQLAGSTANLAIELAIKYLKHKGVIDQ